MCWWLFEIFSIVSGYCVCDGCCNVGYVGGGFGVGLDVDCGDGMGCVSGGGGRVWYCDVGCGSAIGGDGDIFIDGNFGDGGYGCADGDFGIFVAWMMGNAVMALVVGAVLVGGLRVVGLVMVM